MLRNYFKTAFRNFRKNKLFTFINVIGLTIGFAACMLIILFITDEYSFDTFHKNADRIVRVDMAYQSSGTPELIALTGTKPGPQFARMFPEITEYTRTYVASRDLKIGENIFKEPDFLYADPGFFKMFSFNIIGGDSQSPLDAPNKVVITRSTAKKYFPNEDPVGKIIQSGDSRMIVSAVCEDAPENSQFRFDFVAPFLSMNKMVQREDWFTANWHTYLMLDNEAQIRSLQKKIKAYMKGDAVKRELNLSGSDYLTYNLVPLTDLHLKSAINEDSQPNNRMKFIYMLALISLLIFIIAFANYTNLTISQSSSRAGEIGMRKVMGAERKQIFLQFVTEACFISLASLVLAWLLALAVLPLFNQLTGKAFSALSLFSFQTAPWYLGVALLFGVISGIYPALIISSDKTISILKKGFTFTGGNPVLRKALVIAQFSISVFLIIYTLTILQQMHFVKNRNLGYNRENILVLPTRGTDEDLMKNALLTTPGIEAVTTAYETPENIQWGDGITAYDDKGEHNISLNAQPVGLDYVRTLKMKLVAGRDFIKSDFGMMDTTANYENFRQPFIINETLAARLGWKPEEAIGKIISKGASGPVVGVVKDFNYQSLHDPIGPLLLMLSDNMMNVFLARVDGNPSKVIASVEGLWKQRAPDRPFTYNFLDEDYNRLYQAENRSSDFLTVAAALAIFLACLGLFGLAAFTVTKRRKEMGIRKVLGANAGSIVLTISKGFLQLVGTAILIAIPASWLAGNSWLNGFAYRIHVSVPLISITALATLFIAFLTLSAQAIQAARVNPVEMLKDE